MRIDDELQPTAFTADKDFKIDPNYEHTFGLSGSGFWKVWDGAAWLTYTESTGTSQAFKAWALGTGLIRLVVTTGTVTGSFHRIMPRAIMTKGR